jgi:hypothetical protein
MKNQENYPARFYFNISENFVWFWKENIKGDTYITKISPSSIGRILKLVANKNFVYEPFSSVIFIRRKYPNER